MRVRYDKATAAQLRLYISGKFGITMQPLSNRASLLNKIKALDPEMGEDFELRADAAAVEGQAAAAAETEAETVGLSPEALTEALISQGMDPQEASEVAGLTVSAHVRKHMLATGEPPYGPGKEDLYVTVRIGRSTGKFGGEPVNLLVNGERIDVPRGVDWPIRTPFLEVLMHAEQIEFDEIIIAPDQPRRHVPRKSLLYPVHFVSEVPYDRAEAERVGERARRTIKELRGVDITAPGPQAAQAA